MASGEPRILDAGGAVRCTEATAWPALPLDEWRDTRDTLHMWTQVVGKTRLALAPMVNHWWQVPLYVSSRGLTTSRMPYGTRGVEVEFDFLDHVLEIRTSDGETRHLRLAPRSVADFYREYTSTLAALGIATRIWPHPVEVVEAIPFDEDEVHASYDADAATRFWQALAQADRVLHEVRGRFGWKRKTVARDSTLRGSTREWYRRS